MIDLVTGSHQIIASMGTLNAAIDMTCGNGYDTVFLANRAHHVYAFDIQKEAIEATKEALSNASLTNVTLIQAPHETVLDWVKEPVDAVIFNLGYRPKGNPDIRTTSSSTIAAIQALDALIKPLGKIVLVLYPKNKDHEAEAVSNACAALSGKKYDVIQHHLLNKKEAPYIIEITKL